MRSEFCHLVMYIRLPDSPLKFCPCLHQSFQSTIESAPIQDSIIHQINMSDYTGPGLYEIIPYHAQNMSLNVWGGGTKAGTQVKL